MCQNICEAAFMFETDKYDRRLHREPPASPQLAYEPVDNIEGASFLLWAEHCVECAAPSCYSSCDLYQARSDGRCRRFTFGVYKNPAFRSARGYGVEVRFKKWAKLEALGNSAIHPLRSVLRLERSLEYAARTGNLLGKLAHRFNGGSNLKQLTYISLGKLTQAFHRRHRAGPPPEAFLLEIYNPESEEVRLQLIFSTSVDDLRNGHEKIPPIAPAIKTIAVPPGYSCHRFDAALFCSFLDRQVPFKITMVPEAETNAHLVFLTADLVTFKEARAEQNGLANTAAVKCIVWDLDNTIWNGTLIEGDELTLRPGIVGLLKHFDERGVLMSIASKNDREPAVAQLKEFGIDEYFLYPQIDWLPKSHKIRKIAQQLNIGLDAIGFIDDNPFELAEVSKALPQVICIETNALQQLPANPQFQGSMTEESRQRRHYYQEQIAREVDQTAFAEDYIGFLKSCQILLEIAPYDDSDEERIAELVQRTNQLNFSGRKYSRAQLQEIITDSALEKYVLRCSDRYGAYGAVGFCIVQELPNELRVNDFMLSCRVQGKFIEQALFAHLLESHNWHAAEALWVNFHQTERNTPARQVLEALGFKPYESDGGGVVLRQSDPLKCDFICVRCSHGEVRRKV
jgi:FkbH-like protein